VSLCRDSSACVAAALVALHVTSDAEGFAASRLRTLVRLLAGVAVAVDAQTAGAREGLVTCRADVAVLRLGKRRLAGCADIVVVLPWVGSSCARARDRHWEWHSLCLKVGR
jgi:hypothetical protein